MEGKIKKVAKTKRIYQVAKEFHISNEALIEFLNGHKFKVNNHMAPLSDEMYELVHERFGVKEVEVEKESDIRRKIQERKKEDELRKEAIRHEIDEILELSKTDIYKAEKKKKTVTEEKKQIQKKAEREVAPKVKIKKIELEEEPEKREKTKKGTVETVHKEIQPDQKAKETKSEISEKPVRHLKRRPKIKRRKEEEEDRAESTALKGRKEIGEKKKIQEKTGEGELLSPAKKKKRRKRKRRKVSVQIDEKEIEASIKETLAKMGETTKRKRRKKDKETEESVVEEGNVIKTTEFVSVAELANLMNVDSSEVIQACLSLGLMVSINQRLERETILMVADEFGYDVRFLTEYGEENLEENLEEEEEDISALKERPPVVTIMGHVDHGKTSLLDYIRESNIIAGESGGITQHIGAYEVSFKDKKITFLDTPGHEAFTAMRARGAQVTDIVVLVVAADDNVMPQTIEAINHAKAAGVPIVVAINKIDKPNADAERIKKGLSEYNVLVEEWGGKVQCVEISAKTGQNVDHLLELILLESEILELKANPDCLAKAVIIETRVEHGRGIVGSILVKKGTLRKGQPFVAGQQYGRVRAMFDERNQPVNEAPPSTPVQVLGFNGIPQAGDVFSVVESEQQAREIGLKRQQLRREQSFRQIKRLTLDQISKQIAEGIVKELSIIIKADVDGSVEALSDSLMDLGNEDVSVRIIHKGVGSIVESDVLLAEASQAVIIGFHVSPTVKAKELAQKENVDIRLYKVIYDVVNDVKLALSGLLEPELSEEIIGTVEIRDIFKASKVGNIAGCFVVSGKIVRKSLARLLRNNEVIHEGKISSLKRFKEDVKEVTSGFECGITLEGFDDVRVDDKIEAYRIVETARTLK